MRQKRFLTIAVVGLVSVVLTSCLGEKIVVNRQVESSQDGALLLGRQTLDQFHKEPFKDWFAKEYLDYTPHSEAIKSLKKAGINSTRISVFIGTWDTDSQKVFSRLRSEEHSLNSSHQTISYAVFCLKKKLMLLLVWLIFFMVLIKLLPILGTISGKTVKLMVLALICLGNNRQD